MLQYRLRKIITCSLFVLLCCFGNNSLFAQQPVDTNQIKANIQICVDSVVANPPFAQKLASQMLQASNHIRYPWGIFMNTMIIGAVACNEGRFSEAAKLHEEALVHCRNYKFRHKESVVLANIAKDYIGLGDHQKSIGLYQQALRVAQDITDTIQMAQALQGMGECYNRMEYFNEAIKYCGQAAELFTLKNRYQSARMAYNNIGAAYMDANKYDSAYRYIWLSLGEYQKAAPGAPPPADFYMNLAICYDSLGKKDSATYCYEKALVTSKETGDEIALQSVLYYLAATYDKQGKIVKAKEYYKQALRLTEKYNNLEGTIKITRGLSKLYARSGDYANAYIYSKQTEAANDSFLNHKKIQTIAELNKKFETQQLQYEYEKKELVNKVAHEKNLAVVTVANEKKITRRNILLYTFISIAVLLLASIYFLTKYFRQKAIITANRNNELKQRLLLTQMNPHFIFNSVDNIQSLIYNKKEEEAVSYLTKFSKLTRQILENSRENYITLSEELNMLDNYITIQKLLYSNNFSHKVTVDENIDPEIVLLPPMLTQPFIENAIRHGLKDKTEGGVVNIRFYMKEERLFFEVTDNGSGLAVKENEEGQRSLSTQITRERLESIGSKKKIVVQTLNITGADNAVEGVKTFFEIPYVYNN